MIERAIKTEICFYDTRTEGLGAIGVRHDGYKVLVRHVMGHSRPASVGSLTFGFIFMYRNCVVT